MLSIKQNQNKNDINMMNMKQQTKIIKLALNKKSMLITGCAGTGKTTMIKKIRERLLHVYKPEEIGITAMTGVASNTIGGKTLQSYLKIRINKTAGTMIRCIKKTEEKERKYNKSMDDKPKNIWKTCKCLIIDEVSMLGGHFFEELNKVAMRLREEEEFFGGMQLILVGDFFQLPPVTKFEDDEEILLFKSPIFKKNIKNIIELDYIHRQRDPLFLKILDEVRFAILTKKMKKKLRSCIRKLDVSDGIHPTMLYSLNVNVDKKNEEKLNALPGKAKVYVSEDKANESPINRFKKTDEWKLGILNKTRIPQILKLKVGAQVMYLKNDLDLNLFNGSRGVVIKFTESGMPVVRFMNGLEITVQRYKYEHELNNSTRRKGYKLSRFQLPLKLAWAVTIHKSQSLTLDKVKISMANIFTHGHFYVALSRVRTLDGLELMNFYPDKITTSLEVIKFYATFNPSVKFILENCYPGQLSEDDDNYPKKLKKKKRKRKRKKKKKFKRLTDIEDVEEEGSSQDYLDMEIDLENQLQNILAKTQNRKRRKRKKRRRKGKEEDDEDEIPKKRRKL